MSEELARQKAEAAMKIAEMQAASDKTTSPAPPTKAAKPLSDKQSAALSEKPTDKIEVVGNGVSVGGELYTFDKLAKFIDLAQKWYNRQFTSATASAKAKNADKWRQAEKALKAIGCKISKAGEKVSIDTSELKVS